MKRACRLPGWEAPFAFLRCGRKNINTTGTERLFIQHEKPHRSDCGEALHAGKDINTEFAKEFRTDTILLTQGAQCPRAREAAGIKVREKRMRAEKP